jgi:hypothetical protein
MWNTFFVKLLSVFNLNAWWRSRSGFAKDLEGRQNDEARFEDEGGAQKFDSSNPKRVKHRDLT